MTHVCSIKEKKIHTYLEKSIPISVFFQSINIYQYDNDCLLIEIHKFQTLNFFYNLIEDNPDVIRVFSKCNVALSLEIVKGCLLGTAKVLLVKCLGLFNEDFPIVDSNDC